MSNPEESAGGSSVYENTNGMPMANGKNLHMEVGFGDIANRIITVGAVSRAEKIATFLDTNVPTKTITSHRGFTTITGEYHGTPVSIVSIGMGPSMMDFFVRESRAVIRGPMAIVRYVLVVNTVACVYFLSRFGTCGGLTHEAAAGAIVIAASGSGYITRNPDAFANLYDGSAVDTNVKPYNMHKVCPADADLSNLVFSELVANDKLEEKYIIRGTNVTAESFYSSQGRIDPGYDDRNHDIFQLVNEHYPTATTFEMETFMLLHLAKCSKVPIKASAAAIVVANRPTGDVITGDSLILHEAEGGRAILEAIVKIAL